MRNASPPTPRPILPAALAALRTPLAGLQVDSVGHNVLQLHQLQREAGGAGWPTFGCQLPGGAHPGAPATLWLNI
jgi:hypothetical protein